MATPKKLAETDALLILKKRLEKCWELDIDWSLYPSFLQKVNSISLKISKRKNIIKLFTIICLMLYALQGLAQLGKALDVPAKWIVAPGKLLH